MVGPLGKQFLVRRLFLGQVLADFQWGRLQHRLILKPSPLELGQNLTQKYPPYQNLFSYGSCPIADSDTVHIRRLDLNLSSLTLCLPLSLSRSLSLSLLLSLSLSLLCFWVGG